jgi:ABC-type transport system substrate-binding protein
VTIAAPTMPVIPTATSTPIETPTATPSPTVPPTPYPTPTATPAPAWGFYGDPATGLSFSYPSDWIVAEENGAGIMVWSAVPLASVWAQSTLLDETQTVDDHVHDLYGVLDDPDAAEVLTDTTTLLWDGTEARLIEFAEPGSEGKARVVLCARGRRVFTIMLVAPYDTYERFPKTLEAIAASMRVEEPRPYGISRQNALFLTGGQPETLDPAQTHGGSGGMIGAIYSGLVMLDEDQQPIPDLAERWTVSEDGTVYTFSLRENAVFHDGKPVTAYDVQFSWERAADPDTESGTVETYLGDIVGVTEKHRGEADTIAGVRVLDEHTLEVTIEAPIAYFLAKLACPTAYVVDEENVQDEDWQHHPNGTGPFRLTVWEDDELLILERYDRFYLAPARLEHVVYLLYAGVPIWMYENDEIDRAGVGTNDVERVTDPANPLNAELHIAPSTCTTRLIYDVTMPPFDDPLVRQAFAYAIDRVQFTEVVLKGTADPAYSILPPGMPGYRTDIDAPHFDPERAQDLLAASSYGSADALPDITYTTSGWGGELSAFDSALVDMWRTHLGIEVMVEQLDPSTYVAAVREEHGQIFSLGWCADYPDPQNFLDVLYHSESQENIGHYHNGEIDRLLEQARSEADPEARLTLYRQIEQMIVDEAPDILLKHSRGYVLVKPYVVGGIGSALKWRTVDVERPAE